MIHSMFRKSVGMLCAALCFALSVPGPAVSLRAAAGITLSLAQAQALVCAGSKSYRKIQTKISLAEAQYKEAVKSGALKRKEMRTFRWSPLLCFKFPESADLMDAYDWQYKPIKAQCKITTLRHELTDLRYKLTEELSKLYVDAYVAQEKVTFLGRRKEAVSDTLKRGRTKLRMGEAAQPDVDKMEQSLEKIDGELSQVMRELDTQKGKLTEMTGLDVASGYEFENPMVVARIERSALAALTDYTLDNDQGYYEAKMNTRLGQISLEQNESLMEQHYGGKMNVIRPYINRAKKGEEVDQDEFKAAYDSFLYNIDAPWNGDIRILFIRIPKEWFKGSLDGVRYIEDDPYVLMTNALEYIDLKEEEESARSELVTNISDSFEALVTAWNSYNSMKEAVEKQEKDIEKDLLLNRLGELTYEELCKEQEDYASIKMDELEALGSLSGLVYSFDRLTCGGVTKYFRGELTGEEPLFGGDGFLKSDTVEGASYYIHTKIEDNLFVLGITIPEDYSLNVTDYELWVDGTQIGEKTAAAQGIRHLALTLDSIDQAVLRLYDNDRFLGECQIDVLVSKGPLTVEGGYETVPAGDRHAVASFSCRTDAALGVTQISFRRKAGEPIAYYQIQEPGGKALGGSELIPIGEAFRYLLLAGEDLGSLKAAFYGEDKALLYMAELDETSMEAVERR